MISFQVKQRSYQEMRHELYVINYSWITTLWNGGAGTVFVSEIMFHLFDLKIAAPTKRWSLHTPSTYTRPPYMSKTWATPICFHHYKPGTRYWQPYFLHCSQTCYSKSHKFNVPCSVLRYTSKQSIIRIMALKCRVLTLTLSHSAICYGCCAWTIIWVLMLSW